MFKKPFSNPYIYILLLAYYGVWLVWDGIKLPYHNPGEIVSFLPQIRYNPSNNILRFVLAILVPPLACLGLWILLNTSLPKKISAIGYSGRALATVIVGGCLLLAIAMGITQNSTNPANNPAGTYGGPYAYAQLDTFHEGETLGPAVSYQHKDKKPYRDFVIVHGVFQDPLRSVIAFKLFGQSIGASRAFAVILGIITFMSYFALLLVLFRGNVFKSAAGLCLLAILMLPLSTLPFVGSYIFGVQFPFRDIATILFLIAAVVGLRSTVVRDSRKMVVSSLAVGFIAVAGFANSIDRALYIAALSVFWLALIAFLDGAKQFARNTFLPCLAGAVLGIPVLGLALKWAYGDFLSYLLSISKYKEYLDGIVFSQPNIAVSLVLLLVSALITMFGARLLQAASTGRYRRTDVRSKLYALRLSLLPLVREHAVAILLLATAIVFLRSAVGRALPDHFIYSVQWLYLLLVYLGVNYLYRVRKLRPEILAYVAVLMLGILLAFYAIVVKRINIRADTFPVHVQDEKFMRSDQIAATKYLEKNLKGDETFVTLTSEAAWYYFADKPSPIKFPVVWYAFMKPDRQYIADKLAGDKNIRYIVLNNNWTTDFDYVPNEVRFPEAYAVLQKQFVPYRGFGQQTIWIRK